MPQAGCGFFVVTLVLGDNEIADSAPVSGGMSSDKSYKDSAFYLRLAKAIGLREKLAGRFRREFGF